jgi:hypothetical protein
MSSYRPRVSLTVRLAVAERGGWICRLCGEAIDHDPVSPPWPDPLSLSAEHVIPWCDGGNEDPPNLAPAHLACNVKRGGAVFGRRGPVQMTLADAVILYFPGAQSRSWRRLTGERQAALQARFPGILNQSARRAASARAAQRG